MSDKIFAIGGGNGYECFSDVELFDLNIGCWISTKSMLEKVCQGSCWITSYSICFKDVVLRIVDISFHGNCVCMRADATCTISLVQALRSSHLCISLFSSKYCFACFLFHSCM